MIDARVDAGGREADAGDASSDPSHDAGEAGVDAATDAATDTDADAGDAGVDADASPTMTDAALPDADAGLSDAAVEPDADMSDAAVDAHAPDASDTSGLDCVEFRAYANGSDAPFGVGIANDAMFDFAFAAPWNETVYGVVIRPLIDNAAVLRHLALYRVDVAPSTGVSPTTGVRSEGGLVYAWGPGSEGVDLRAHGDVGLPLTSGTFVLGTMYASDDPTALDASGIEVCVQTEAPEQSVDVTMLGYDNGVESYWAGVGGWPSGACSAPSAQWVGTCDPQNAEPIRLLVAQPHMHERGTHMRSVIVSPDGSQRPLFDADFAYAAHPTFALDETLLPGERIVTTCDYSQPTCAGLSMQAEACHLYVYASPQGTLQDGGRWGRTAHGEACLGQ